MKVLDILGWLCWAITMTLLLLSMWYGARMEIGKPGDKWHIVMQMYGAKRHFK